MTSEEDRPCSGEDLILFGNDANVPASTSSPPIVSNSSSVDQADEQNKESEGLKYSDFSESNSNLKFASFSGSTSQKVDLEGKILANKRKRKFVCLVCQMEFSSSEELSQHKTTHTKEELTRPFKCLTCHKRFTAKRSLNLHEVAIHLKQKQYQCKFCKKMFGYKSNWKKHEGKCLLIGYQLHLENQQAEYLNYLRLFYYWYTIFMHQLSSISRENENGN